MNDTLSASADCEKVYITIEDRYGLQQCRGISLSTSAARALVTDLEAAIESAQEYKALQIANREAIDKQNEFLKVHRAMCKQGKTAIWSTDGEYVKIYDGVHFDDHCRNNMTSKTRIKWDGPSMQIIRQLVKDNT